MTGADLAAWRARMGWDRAQAATYLGVPCTMLPDWESGAAAIPKWLYDACDAIEAAITDTKPDT